VNASEVKRILINWRPGHGENDPLVDEALQEARRDPALRRWLERQTTFHREMRDAFLQIPVSPELKDQILARARTVRVTHWWQQPPWISAAAVIALLLGLAAFWLRPPPGPSFDTFRSRMVRTVLRQYSMDVETSDMTQIRRFHATNNAPSDYVLPQGLERLPALGAGLLSWQDRQVAMVCLGSTNNRTLFLFVVDRASVAKPPPATPEFVPVSKLMTASWTDGNKSYVLAVQGAKDSLQKFF
jgi:hypothetical protein